MKPKSGIGYQSYEEIVEKNIFYIDKTLFIKDWWEYADKVTLITRPRRFGKTLGLSTIECFFSNKYAGKEICLREKRYGKRKNTGSCRGNIQ